MKIKNCTGLTNGYIYQTLAEQKKRRYMGAGITKLPTNLPNQLATIPQKTLIIPIDPRQGRLVAKMLMEFARNQATLRQAEIRNFNIGVADFEQVRFYLMATLFCVSEEHKA